MVLMALFLIVGIALFVGSLVMESKAAPAPTGDAALPPTQNERIWAGMRVASLICMTIGLCGLIILGRAGIDY
jgi:hypothetical protein